MPMSPPIRESVIASIKNWSRMWRRRAPTAIRKPISRVRSVTDTSMMFMMPMPPTSSEMLAITAISRRIVVVMTTAMAAISDTLLTSKSSLPGLTRWLSRSTRMTSSLTAPVWLGSRGLVSTVVTRSSPTTRCCTVVIGRKIWSSWSAPMGERPLGPTIPTTRSRT